jgi:hypothetical protein
VAKRFTTLIIAIWKSTPTSAMPSSLLTTISYVELVVVFDGCSGRRGCDGVFAG